MASVVKIQPNMVGLAVLAYTFGLRHAFDVDHIAAIDNTVRKLLQQKVNPTGVGFFFSLGHSTVVFVLAVVTIISTQWMTTALPQFENIGSVLGTSISGVFLLVIGTINFIVFVNLIGLFRQIQRGHYQPEAIEQQLNSRGFFTRILSFAMKLVSKSWHIYPIGFLFGLGFDTASEVALLTIFAEAARGSLPLMGILGLPIFFAAGMVTVDTFDGVMMMKTYTWAFLSPLRKLYYNLSITGLAVATALVIGFVELGQVIASEIKWHGMFWTWLQGINFGDLGYVLVALFVLAWLISYGGWKLMNQKEG